MHQAELTTILEELGVPEGGWRAVALLPLVEVAWADGRIQRAERAVIDAAVEGLGLSAPERAAVDVWLEVRPDSVELARGRRALLELAHRDPDDTAFDGILGRCEAVARAAGGLFGVAFAVSEEERLALRDIADALALGPSDLRIG